VNLRLFVALEFPLDIKTSINQILDQLRQEKMAKSLRISRFDHLHITLKFLGDTPEEQIESIENALSATLSGIHPFELSLKQIDTFPRDRSPRVIWLGLDGNLPKLRDLVDQLETALTPLGFQKEERPFTPHLTLARIKKNSFNKKDEAHSKLLSIVKTPYFTPFQVEKVSLMKSTLKSEGSNYECLKVFKL